LIKERTNQLLATNKRLEREIAERKQAEERLKISLEEKVALLGEVHHRVKNNLQVIASLLEMSKARATNQDAINLLSEAHAKIYTMALIHTQLYESDRFDQIDMQEHCRSLINYLQYLYTKNQNIHYTLNANNIHLSVTQAIPCGLILNELISNAFKHAFRDTRKGQINVLMEKSTEETIFLKVKDNGVGMPKEVNVDQTDSLGLKLVRNLVEKQLGGKLGIKRNKGTEILIEFKISGG
jgi:two-component sensor histidine kinase